jgi:multicomponent K+:H+ antiporter subunit A
MALAADAGGAPRSLMLQVAARLLLPLATLVSVFMFLRGHNQPGGGFIAGLVLAIALILQFIANGPAWMAQRMRGDFRGWVGWGLLIAGATGMASWLFGAPFLTSSYDYPVWPLIGPVPLASAALFDLGVYLTVVGATMVALLAIAQLGEASNPECSEAASPSAPNPTPAAAPPKAPDPGAGHHDLAKGTPESLR